MSDDTSSAPHNGDALYDNLIIDRKPGSEIEITGEIPTTVVTAQRPKAIQSLGRNAALPGFRKGKIPADVLEKHFGEPRILAEIAELVLARAYPDIVITENLDVVGRPAVSLTKVAPGNPIGFRIHATVMPEVSLPDYRAIAEKVRADTASLEAHTVTDEEVKEVITRIRQDFAHHKYHEEHPSPPAGESHEHGEFQESELPELTDEFVKGLGNFESVADFTARIRESLAQEKTLRHKEKQRLAIIEAIVAHTKADVPALFIESELDKMMREMHENVTRMGLTVEGYLARIEKSESALREEWLPEAEKRAKTQLVLSRIAEGENLIPDEAHVEREVTSILGHYKDADPDTVRLYVASMLRNEMVFRRLEGDTQEAPDQDGTLENRHTD